MSISTSQTEPLHRSLKDPLSLARDLVAYRRRNGNRVLVVVGVFDRVTPAEALAIAARTTPFGDSVIAAVEASPDGALNDLESRMRLACCVCEIEHAVPYQGSPERVIEILQPDEIVDLNFQ